MEYSVGVDNAPGVHADPIKTALQLWRSQMNPHMRILLSKYLSRRSRLEHVRIGSMFSGTDIIGRVFPKVAQFIEAEHRVVLKVDTAFQCEAAEEKRQWLLEQFKDKGTRLFTDTALLSQPKSFCVRSGSYVRIPFVDMLVGGFVCKSRSSANKSSKANLHCVRQGREATGETFEHIRSFVQSRQPLAVLLENVDKLSEGGDVSDAAFIIETLSELGYGARYFRLEAQDFGAPCRRTRLFFIALHAHGADMSEVVAKLDFIQSFLEVWLWIIPPPALHRRTGIRPQSMHPQSHEITGHAHRQ